MLERHTLLSKRKFVKKLFKTSLIGCLAILCSLLIGMVGYQYFENLSLVDAFVNASMILSGMGQVAPLQTTGGKIFAGLYALFSGIIFLFIIAVILSPVIHRFLQQFHIDNNE